MKRPKKKTGGNADAAHRSNNESLRDQASLVNATGTRATKSEKIKATLKAKAEKFRSQTIKVDENWSIVRADELNWQIRHKDQRAPYNKWFFGTLRAALLALPDKMLGEEAKGTIDDVRRCYKGICEAVLNALREGSFELIKTVAKGGGGLADLSEKRGE
jgi:hypothetical protein